MPCCDLIVNAHSNIQTCVHESAVEAVSVVRTVEAVSIACSIRQPEWCFLLTRVDTAAAPVNDCYSLKAQAVFCHLDHDILRLEVPHAPPTFMHAEKSLHPAHVTHRFTHVRTDEQQLSFGREPKQKYMVQEDSRY